MFDKLRRQLTVTNVVVVGLILMLFALGFFLLMKINIERQTNDTIQLIANGIGSQSMEDNRRREREWQRHFYVKVNPQGEIVELSSNLAGAGVELNTLVQSTLSSPVPDGRIRWGREEYRFAIKPLINVPDFAIIYVDTHKENELMQSLVLAIIVAGAGALLLIWFGSRYLANRALIPIANSWERQKQFVADASHELRTPLAVMQTNLELIKGNAADTVESQLKWIGYIETENQRMSKLVNQLLTLARVDSAQEQLQRQPFSLSRTIKETIASLEPIAAVRGVRIMYESWPLEIEYNGDEARIRQLLVILLDNAIKYNRDEGSIKVQLSQSVGELIVTVADSGIGIAEQHLTHVFERFYRVDEARGRNLESTGLGLAIAEWIVRAHGGTIAVMSEVGRGTTFTVKFKITPALG